MKRLIFGLFTVLAVAAFQPEVKASDCEPCDQSIFCDPCAPVCNKKESLWDFGIWAEAGIYGNEYGQKNRYVNGRLDTWSGNTGFLQNVRQSDFQLNQLWVYGQRKLSKRGFSVGGRVDFAFGTDAVYL